MQFEESPRESNTLSAKVISLVGISDDGDINKDAKFIEETSRAFHQ